MVYGCDGHSSEPQPDSFVLLFSETDHHCVDVLPAATAGTGHFSRPVMAKRQALGPVGKTSFMLEG